jgi:hypothetical protein
VIAFGATTTRVANRVVGMKQRRTGGWLASTLEVRRRASVSARSKGARRGRLAKTAQTEHRRSENHKKAAPCGCGHAAARA